MIKYFGYSDALSIEQFWKEVIPVAHSISIQRSNKRSTARFENVNGVWKQIGFMDISQVIPSQSKLLNTLMFESNCGAVATIQ